MFSKQHCSTESIFILKSLRRPIEQAVVCWQSKAVQPNVWGSLMHILCPGFTGFICPKAWAFETYWIGPIRIKQWSRTSRTRFDLQIPTYELEKRGDLKLSSLRRQSVNQNVAFQSISFNFFVSPCFSFCYFLILLGQSWIFSLVHASGTASDMKLSCTKRVLQERKISIF